MNLFKRVYPFLYIMCGGYVAKAVFLVYATSRACCNEYVFALQVKAPRGVVWRSRTIRRRSRDVAPRRQGAFTPLWDPVWFWRARADGGCGSGPESHPNLLGTVVVTR